MKLKYMNYYNVSVSLAQCGLFIMGRLGDIERDITNNVFVNKFLTHFVGMK